MKSPVRNIIIFLLVWAFCPCCASAGVQLLGNVDNRTRDELLAYFRDGARLFAGGYIVDEFEPGLDKYIVSIENDNGTFIVTLMGRPCKRTEFHLIKVCYNNRCHWDLDNTYRCVGNRVKGEG